MPGRQPFRQLQGQTSHFFLRQRSGSNSAIKRYSSDKFADEQVVFVNGVEIVDGLDGGMVKPRKNQGFVAESFARDRVIEHSGRKYFDGDFAFEFVVITTVNNAHSTRTDLFLNAVASHRLADDKRHAFT